MVSDILGVLQEARRRETRNTYFPVSLDNFPVSLDIWRFNGINYTEYYTDEVDTRFEITELTEYHGLYLLTFLIPSGVIIKYRTGTEPPQSRIGKNGDVENYIKTYHLYTGGPCVFLFRNTDINALVAELWEVSVGGETSPRNIYVELRNFRFVLGE